GNGIPNSARTEARYSAIVSRRMPAGSSSGNSLGGPSSPPDSSSPAELVPEASPSSSGVPSSTPSSASSSDAEPPPSRSIPSPRSEAPGKSLHPSAPQSAKIAAEQRSTRIHAQCVIEGARTTSPFRGRSAL